MSVVIGNLSFTDAWIKNKWGGQIEGRSKLKKWIENGQKAFTIPNPPCSIVAEKNKSNIVKAIDGTEWIVACGEEAQQPQVSVSVNTTTGKVGDYVFITVEIQGNVGFYALDNYGKEYTATETKVFMIRLTDEWDTYEFVYKACSQGVAIAQGIISITVQENNRLVDRGGEKEIVINTLNSTQASQLGLLLGQRVSISDNDVSFQNALITSIEIDYIANDMPDVITRQVHNADVYTARVRFVP